MIQSSGEAVELFVDMKVACACGLASQDALEVCAARKVWLTLRWSAGTKQQVMGSEAVGAPIGAVLLAYSRGILASFATTEQGVITPSEIDAKQLYSKQRTVP